jgi:hypothetical protein
MQGFAIAIYYFIADLQKKYKIRMKANFVFFLCHRHEIFIAKDKYLVPMALKNKINENCRSIEKQ